MQCSSPIPSRSLDELSLVIVFPRTFLLIFFHRNKLQYVTTLGFWNTWNIYGTTPNKKFFTYAVLRTYMWKTNLPNYGLNLNLQAFSIEQIDSFCIKIFTIILLEHSYTWLCKPSNRNKFTVAHSLAVKADSFGWCNTR